MSFDGHVLCQRILIAPCALTTLGAATAAVVASAAPLRNLRRVAAADEVVLGIYSLPGSDLRDDMVRLLRLTRPNSSYSGKAGCMGGSLYGVLSPRTSARIVSPHATGKRSRRTCGAGA